MGSKGLSATETGHRAFAASVALPEPSLCPLEIYRPPLCVPYYDRAWMNPFLNQQTGSFAYALNLPEIGDKPLGSLNRRAREIMPSDKPFSRQRIRELAEVRDGLHYFDTLPSEGNEHIIGFRYSRPQEGGMPSRLLIARRNESGIWSYRKPSDNIGCIFRPPFSNQDDSGNVITDLESAALRDFPLFGGYAAIPYEGVLFAKMFDFPNFSRDGLEMPSL